MYAFIALLKENTVITVLVLRLSVVKLRVHYKAFPNYIFDLLVSTAAVTTSIAVPWDVVSPQLSPSISCGISGMYCIDMKHRKTRKCGSKQLIKYHKCY